MNSPFSFFKPVRVILNSSLGSILCTSFLLFSFCGCEQSDSKIRNEVIKTHGPLRATSVKPWADKKVGDLLAFDYLLQRTALQWNNVVELELVATVSELADGTREFAFVGITPDGEELSKISSAVPVDSMGYFLTAAHNVESGQVLLVCERPQRPPVEVRGTVIWNGLELTRPASENESIKCDLAIVFAPMDEDTDLQVMPWADLAKIQPRQAVLVGGAGATAIRLAGGTILPDGIRSIDLTKNKEQPEDKWPFISKMVEIMIDTPLIPGDSGGPAMLGDGTFVGVAVSTSNDPLRRSRILRPDVSLINRFIKTHKEMLDATGKSPKIRSQTSFPGWTRLKMQRDAIDQAIR